MKIVGVRMGRVLLLVMICAGLGVAVRSVLGTDIKAQTGAVEVVTGPAQWIEFTAVYTHSESGRPPILGRFFRAADGSERLESGTSLDDVQGITIHNYSEAAFYTKDPIHGWHGYPMDVPEAPPLGARRGLYDSLPKPLSYDGFEALQKTGAGGIVARVIPALNFFTVDRVTPTGARTSFSSIRVGNLQEFIRTLPSSQARRYTALPTLFDPPAEEPIAWHTETRGVIRTVPAAKRH